MTCQQMYREDAERLYVNPDGLAVVKCPHCGATRTVRGMEFKGPKRRVRIKCRCQSSFPVSLEFRRASRKEIHIPGRYTKLASAEEHGEMRIKNISVFGIGFDAVNGHNLSIGDKLTVRFTVGSKRKSEEKENQIEREAVVRWVDNKYIGCEFMKPIGYDTVDALSGFYLMP